MTAQCTLDLYSLPPEEETNVSGVSIADGLPSAETGLVTQIDGALVVTEDTPDHAGFREWSYCEGRWIDRGNQAIYRRVLQNLTTPTRRSSLWLPAGTQPC